ncbi:BLOC-2 complex member HPS3-like isoform X2 [Tubulanus polymorphus]|uniref:BLOC-2 complex member HPS3-like isoform X2 n=1 Tax=Tubulanus polymorphus TaxID=672921 RepID=UPI003DA6031D
MENKHLCHHFVSQDVFSTSKEPLSVCVSNTEIFIATADPKIEIYKLGETKTGKIQSLQSMSTIQTMSYSNKGEYIVTLEKNSRDERFARVYMNWRDGNLNAQKAIVAGKVKHLLNKSSRNSPFLLVIEIPTQGSPTSFTCCSETGNIGLTYEFGSRNTVSIYRFDRYSQQYGDFFRYLEVDFSFPLINCSLCENYLSVCSEFDVQIIQIHQRFEEVRRRSFALGACEEAESNMEPFDDWSIVDRYHENIDFDDLQTKSIEQNSAGYNLPKLINLPSIESARELEQQLAEINGIEVLGMIDSIPGHPVSVKLKDRKISSQSDDGSKSVFTQRTCVYRRFKKSRLDRLLSVELIPTYRSSSVLSSDDADFLTSNLRDNLAGMACLVSSRNHCYMYNVMETPRLLSTYDFPLDTVNKVIIGDNLIHTVSNDGLNTYTSRHFVSVLHHLKDCSDISKICPPVTLPPCNIGIQKFILGKIQDACVCNEYVILLCKADTYSDSNAWSIYALKNPASYNLSSDVYEMAVSLKTDSFTDHYQLLQESWLLFLWSERFTRFHSNKQTVSDQLNIVQLKYDIAATLADYYALPHRQQWNLALPFYQLSGRSLESIVTQNCGSNELKPCYGRGFLNYLNFMVFDEKSLEIGEACANQILQIYSQEAPEKLSTIILNSNINKYKTELVLILMNDWILTTENEQFLDLDYLALSILNLKVGELDTAKSYLSKISQESLIRICAEIPHLFINEKFTDLSQMIRCENSDLFIQLLLILQDKHINNYYYILNLLKGVDGAETNDYVNFLERVLSDESRKSVYPSLAKDLALIYMRHMKKQQLQLQLHPSSCSTTVLKSGTGHFANRFNWLNSMPPFNGSAPANYCIYQQHERSPRSGRHQERSPRSGRHQERSPHSGRHQERSPRSGTEQEDSTRSQCSCVHCYKTLLSLQMLLSSDEATEELLSSVNAEITTPSDKAEYSSIWVLCNIYDNTERIVNYLLQLNPLVLPICINEIILTKSGRKINCKQLIENLTQKLKQLDSKTQRETDCETECDIEFETECEIEFELMKNIYKEILLGLTKRLNIHEFLQLLPSDGCYAFFHRLICECIKYYNAQKILDSIMDRVQT